MVITLNEAPNPFALLLQGFAESFVPVFTNVMLNRDKLKEWSSDVFQNQEVQRTLKKYMPEVFTGDGRVNTEILKQYATSDDEVKSYIAKTLLDTQERRQKLKQKNLLGLNQILMSGAAADLYEPKLNVEAITRNQKAKQALKKIFGEDDTINALLETLPVNPQTALSIMLLQKIVGDRNAR